MNEGEAVRSSSAMKEGRTTSSMRTKTTNRPQSKKKGGGKGLKAKEEEYRRMNAELEAKTSELVKEAEQLLEGNLSILSDLESSCGDKAVFHNTSHDPAEKSHDRNKQLDDEVTRLHDSTTFKGQGKKPMPRKSNTRPTTSFSVTAVKSHSSPKRPNTSQSVKSQSRPQGKRSHNFSGGIDPDILATIRRLEEEDNGTDEGERAVGGEGVAFPGGQGRRRDFDDVIPPTMDDMGTEASIRFLKAKLRVMQEELDQLCQENSDKDKLIISHEAEIKELTATKTKLERSVQSSAMQLNKYKQSSADAKQKSEGLEAQLVSLRKELDALKNSQKKATSQHSVVEVRLNRALEDVEKYKSALQKSKGEARESSKLDRQKVDRLLAENKQLEKQKTELMTAFKKQMKLIDILKRQKMHIEAAKLLSFTEDEFVKALDWDGTN